MAALVFGRVPHPPYVDRLILKPEGVGWDNLGKRTPRGIVLHRMIGSLQGTDSWFRRPEVKSLTDYGVGVAATDGAKLAGTIYRWNDPRGIRSGWASGPARAPWGDGKIFVAAHGINAVNRDLVSCEISGEYGTPLDSLSFAAIASLIAYWADQYSVPWESFPRIPAEGRSFVLWHNQFTGRDYKECPGAIVMDQTDELVAAARAILQKHQQSAPPAPDPSPSYVSPGPIPKDDGRDHDMNGIKFYAIKRIVAARAGARFRQYASTSAPETRAPARDGEEFWVGWAVRSSDGDWWWATHPRGSRVRMADTNTRVEVSTV
jgi:hypothetical protein